LGLLAIVAAALVAINVLSWRGVFWAAWPLLALAALSAMWWVRRQSRFDRRNAALAVVALGLVGINLLSWHGTFWAIWPVLGIAVVTGIHWSTRR
jgi:hypothetical protein